MTHARWSLGWIATSEPPAPVRLRLSREKHYSLQLLSLATNGLPAVRVARRGKWGNPFDLRSPDHCWTALAHGFRADPAGRQAASVAMFRAWLLNGRADHVDIGLVAEKDGAYVDIVRSPRIDAPAPPTLDDVRTELRGRNLACWCKLGAPCHADVLLELANRPLCDEVTPGEARPGVEPTVSTRPKTDPDRASSASADAPSGGQPPAGGETAARIQP